MKYCDYIKKELNALKNGTLERVTVTDGANTGLEILSDGNDILAISKDAKSNDFSSTISELIQATPHIVMFGSGHVAKALYTLCTFQGLPVTVIDPRIEMNNEDRFPLANRYLNEYTDIPNEISNIFNPYFVIFTHGHSGDKDCLKYCLENRPASSYIGMIGSKGKVLKTYEELKKEGFDEDELEKVHSPIGIKIGGDSPEEIAISIMAEIISVYSRKKHSARVDIPFLEMLSKTTEGVLCRIITKTGSGPRAIGTQMLVTKTGIKGTIGGGKLENQVIEDALKIKEDTVKHYGLTPLDLGMICGGEVDILFTVL